MIELQIYVFLIFLDDIFTYHNYLSLLFTAKFLFCDSLKFSLYS